MRLGPVRAFRCCLALLLLLAPCAEAGAGALQDAAVFCAPVAGDGRTADDTGPIAWSNGKPLAWQDFRAPAPAGAVDGAASCIGFDVSWECEDARLVFDIRAIFDPDRSWVRTGSEDARLLRHEQGHFDMTEASARRLRKQFTFLEDPCKDPHARQLVDGMIIGMYREWGGTQTKYDEETR